MFEQASKIKLRFDVKNGQISTEDLWDLPLTSARGTSLDGLFKSVNKEVKSSEEESFVIKANTTNVLANLRLELIKHIITSKVEANEAKNNLANENLRKEKIRELISEKKDENLKGLSVEELEKLL